MKYTYIQIQFLDFPAVWPQENYLNSLWFGFFIYKVELVDNGYLRQIVGNICKA